MTDPSGDTADAPDHDVFAMLLCDYAIMEQQSSKGSAIGTFDDITCVRVPTFHHRAAIFARARLAPTAATASFVFVSPDEEEILTVRFDVPLRDAESARQPLTLAFNLPMIPIPIVGRYRIDFRVDGRTIRSVDFDVRLAQPAEAQS